MVAATPKVCEVGVRIAYDRGIFLPQLDLWLDPQRQRERAFISHAHSDHVRHHRRPIMTEATARFVRQRASCRPPPRGGGLQEAAILEFGSPTPYMGPEGPFEVTLYPAGHILGSAQILVEYRGRRLLYSGDFKLRPSLTAEAIEVPEADVLVMETTFGRPRYVFPPTDEVVASIVAFCHRALADAAVPVLLGYSLGKGQELLARLAAAGFSVVAHPALHALAEVYRGLGVALPAVEAYEGGPLTGRVLVCPPGAQRAGLRDILRRCTAYISGWGVGGGATWMRGADAVFALSDHADYPELHEYVSRVHPAEVYTIHGFADEFARALQARGYRARPLRRVQQLPLL